jgi:hypothetical protein
LAAKEVQKTGKYTGLCDAQGLVFKPLVTSWGGFGAHSFETIGLIAQRLATRELIAVAAAKRTAERRLQTAFMKQIAANGTRFLDEMAGLEEEAARKKYGQG